MHGKKRTPPHHSKSGSSSDRERSRERSQDRRSGYLGPKTGGAPPGRHDSRGPHGGGHGGREHRRPSVSPRGRPTRPPRDLRPRPRTPSADEQRAAARAAEDRDRESRRTASDGRRSSEHLAAVLYERYRDNHVEPWNLPTSTISAEETHRLISDKVEAEFQRRKLHWDSAYLNNVPKRPDLHLSRASRSDSRASTRSGSRSASASGPQDGRPPGPPLPRPGSSMPPTDRAIMNDYNDTLQRRADLKLRGQAGLPLDTAHKHRAQITIALNSFLGALPILHLQPEHVQQNPRARNQLEFIARVIAWLSDKPYHLELERIRMQELAAADDPLDVLNTQLQGIPGAPSLYATNWQVANPIPHNAPAPIYFNRMHDETIAYGTRAWVILQRLLQPPCRSLSSMEATRHTLDPTASFPTGTGANVTVIWDPRSRMYQAVMALDPTNAHPDTPISSQLTGNPPTLVLTDVQRHKMLENLRCSAYDQVLSYLLRAKNLRLANLITRSDSGRLVWRDNVPYFQLDMLAEHVERYMKNANLAQVARHALGNVAEPQWHFPDIRHSPMDSWMAYTSDVQRAAINLNPSTLSSVLQDKLPGVYYQERVPYPDQHQWSGTGWWDEIRSERAKAAFFNSPLFQTVVGSLTPSGCGREHVPRPETIQKAQAMLLYHLGASFDQPSTAYMVETKDAAVEMMAIIYRDMEQGLNFFAIDVEKRDFYGLNPTRDELRERARRHMKPAKEDVKRTTQVLDSAVVLESILHFKQVRETLGYFPHNPNPNQHLVAIQICTMRFETFYIKPSPELVSEAAELWEPLASFLTLAGYGYGRRFPFSDDPAHYVPRRDGSYPTGDTSPLQATPSLPLAGRAGRRQLHRGRLQAPRLQPDGVPLHEGLHPGY